MDKQKVEKLLSSKNFCIIPWIHLHAMPDGLVLPCCLSVQDDFYGNGKSETLKEIWNSEKFKKLRLNMLNDVKSAGCSQCYLVEGLKQGSMRQYFNNHYQQHIGVVEKTNHDGSLDHLSIKSLDIRFSNLCNFKCRGCCPPLSSAWYEDYRLLHNNQSDDPKVKSLSVDSPLFWREVRSMIPHAETVCFSGGEPLIMKEHFEILKELDAASRYGVTLNYNTNLSYLNYAGTDMVEIWARFKKVILAISIDDIGGRAEYFRSGTNWSNIEKNMFHLRDNYKNIFRYVNCTVNIMNVFYIPELFDYLMENKIIGTDSFNLSLLFGPDELSIQVLPKEMKGKVKEKLLRHIEGLVARGPEFIKAIYDIKSIINFMEEKDQSYLLPVFRENTLKLDKMRAENFLEVYPELSEIMS